MKACRRNVRFRFERHSSTTAASDAGAAGSHPRLRACRCRSTRNLTDEQLDAIRESGGIVGFNFSVCAMRPDGRLGEDTSLDTVVSHLSYLVDRLGEDHVALGSDFDGAVMPGSIRDASCLPNLVHSPRAHGFNDATINKITFDNWMRVFRRSWH